MTYFEGIPVLFIFLTHFLLFWGRERHSIRVDLEFQTAIYFADAVYAAGFSIQGIGYLQALGEGKTLGKFLTF